MWRHVASGPSDTEFDPRELQAELESRLRQQAAVAAVGQRALAGASLAELLDEIVTVVQDNLGVDIVGYLHCSPEPGFIQAVAGVGWPGELEHDGRLLPLVEGGLTARALGRQEPILVDDLTTIDPPSPVLVAAGVRSSILVPIHGEQPLGLIGAHSRVPRCFTQHDADFLAAAANVVAVAHGRLEAEAALRHRATHDTLTGLPNRAVLHDRLEAAIAGRRAGGGSCALLLVDLDGFKDVNDTLGHGVGDSLLRAVAGRLAGTIDPADTVARLGGDEFAIALSRVADQAGAERIARQVLAALEDAPVVDGMPIPVDASVGVALFPAHGDSPAALLQRADLAMYRAKRFACGVQTYEARDDGPERKRLERAGQLRSALEQGQLTLAYQPKVSLRDGAVVGAEALVRWNHPTEGLLMPGEFLPLIEPTATIVTLSRWVVHEAVAQATRWGAEGLDLQVAVNRSARYLQSPTMALDVLEALWHNGLPADRLVVELTESAVITNPTAALATVRRLVQAGVRISIDDFGTGFASLAQLEQLPATEVKIDRRLVAGLDEVETADGGLDSERCGPREAIVRAILDLGARLDIDVVAEGVETVTALRRLARYGCPLVQGYLISRPVPAEELPAIAAGRSWTESLLLATSAA
ncbi:MAG: putative bifunctional diguanylate cyclase/phosphodiesterase [Acidimicrobiia bacterium]